MRRGCCRSGRPWRHAARPRLPAPAPRARPACAFEGHAQLIGATWGFAPETATHALRLVHSGLFDRFPSLTVVLGHLGETLPYFAWRIQHCFEFNPADKRLERRLQDYLCDNFYVSTSGFFSDQALIGAVLTIGADRILFAVDYPYEPMDAGDRLDRARADQRERSPEDRPPQRARAVQLAAAGLTRHLVRGHLRLRSRAPRGRVGTAGATHDPDE